ncbi:MAG: endonuclease domain-containing protein, partial [Sedimenticola sp.]
YKPLGGSMYIDLPVTLKKSRAILNVRNMDNKCFLWAVLSGLHSIYMKPENVEHYAAYEDTLNMQNIPYPVPIAKIDKFEKQNIDISLNVFGFDNDEIYPLKITKQKHRKHHINLLYLQEGDISHYCLITDLNGFLSRTKANHYRHYFCPYCLNGFTRQTLFENHEKNCSINGEQKITLPEKDKNDVLKFETFQQQLMCPFVLYCDFETIVRDVHTCAPDPKKSSTTVTKHQEVCSYGYKRVCTDDRYTKESAVYRGPDAARHFVEALLDEEEEISNILNAIEPLRMSDEDELDFIHATRCSICSERFGSDEYTKVRDHDHLTGRYRGAAHNNCNLQFRTPSFIPVFFHGLRNFDGHIIMQCIGEYESCSRQGIKCIPQNMERYISFSLGKLRFLDSFSFLSSSLESLTENLKMNGGLSNFKYFASEFEDENVARLLLRKNVYPYTYMNDESKFEEIRLPPKEAFYSEVKKSHISDADYDHACNVFNILDISTMGEYSDLYLRTDVLLLSDIFQNFRRVCHRDYGLDPCHFYSVPGLSWAAMLKMTGVQLQLITDIDELLFWERGLRG